MTVPDLRSLLDRRAALLLAATVSVCTAVPLLVAGQHPAPVDPARAPARPAAAGAGHRGTPATTPGPRAARTATATATATTAVRIPRYVHRDPFGSAGAKPTVRPGRAAADAAARTRRTAGEAAARTAAAGTTPPAGTRRPAPARPAHGDATRAAATTPATAPAVPVLHPIHTADVRLSVAGSVSPVRRNLPRLALLGPPHAPVAIFLGLRRDHRAATFALGTGVVAVGRHCGRPRRACTVIVVPAGHRVRLLDAAHTSYWLRVRRISTRRTASVSVARTAHRRVSAAGACYLRALGVSDIRLAVDGIDIRWADRAAPCR